MFIYHLLLKPKFNRENGNARNVFYIVMHGICECWLIFVIWRANFKIGDLICSIRVLAMRIAHANNGFAVYFVNNRMALFAQSQHARTQRLNYDFICKTKSKLSLFTKRLNFLANIFFLPVFVFCQFEIGRTGLNIDIVFLHPFAVKGMWTKGTSKNNFSGHASHFGVAIVVIQCYCVLSIFHMNILSHRQHTWWIHTKHDSKQFCTQCAHKQSNASTQNVNKWIKND